MSSEVEVESRKRYIAILCYGMSNAIQAIVIDDNVYVGGG